MTSVQMPSKVLGGKQKMRLRGGSGSGGRAGMQPASSCIVNLHIERAGVQPGTHSQNNVNINFSIYCPRK